MIYIMDLICGRIKVVDHEEPASDGKKEQE
jgi:hypothetical protein